MEKMDAKERKMLQHYKETIENRLFDEYDILGFLIFIRRHLDNKKYKYIPDFADLIAHRERDKGIVHDCILAAKDSDYTVNSDGKSLKEYHGIETEKWKQEWCQLGTEFSLKIDDELIKEITLCVFSLSQNSQYITYQEKGKKRKSGDKISLGTIKLIFGKDKFLYLITAENRGDAPWVVFAKYGLFDFVREDTEFYLKEPVETIRENGKLRLFDKNGYIL